MIQHTEHHWTWAERAIWWLCHSFGAVTILICISTGAAVWLTIIFRKTIKDKIGDLLALADDFVNKGK